jgi:hypothetical protein
MVSDETCGTSELNFCITEARSATVMKVYIEEEFV